MWREALPSGNGVVGAAAYGGVQEETVMIQHNELWHAGIRSPLPDVSHTLRETRQLIDEQQYAEASWLLANELRQQGYEASLAKPLPVADLRVHMACRDGFKNYRRRLDMETGEVMVSWRDGIKERQRRLFVSRADDMIVCEIGGEGEPFDVRIGLDLHVDGRSSWPTEEMKASRAVQIDGEYMMYAATNEADGKDYGIVMRVLPACAKYTDRTQARGESDSDSAMALFRITGQPGTPEVMQIERTNGVLLLLRVFVRGEREREWQRIRDNLDAVTEDYETLLARHVAIHRPLFQSVSIDLGARDDDRSNEELLLEAYEGAAPAALIEKMWAYGRYLFISAVRPDGLPCALYGLWGGDYRAQWSHYMANENVQMMYWHIYAGGLAELAPSLFHYYESLMDDFRENARKLYGCRGIFVPAGTTPGMGLPNQVVPVIMNWSGAAGWLAQHYYRHVQYTGNLDFLRKRALPFMREVAAFYEDFLVMGDDGLYRMYPSVSPENTPGNFMPEPGRKLDHPMPTTVNATMDIAIIRELFTHLIEGSRQAGMYGDDLPLWEAILERLPKYQINEDHAMREWMHADFADHYSHRHLSHLYPVFPGQEVTRENHPDLFAACAEAVERRLIVGLSAQSGWSLAHLANTYARLGEGDRALECLDLLARSCVLNNFFTLHNDYRNMGICLSHRNAPVQLDANLGWVSAVQEMLLYADPSIVKLLPALPKTWSHGHVRGLRFHTGMANFSWDVARGVFQAELQAVRDTELTVQLPACLGEDRLDYEFDGCVDGQVEVEQSPYGAGYYSVHVAAGRALRIQAGAGVRTV